MKKMKALTAFSDSELFVGFNDHWNNKWSAFWSGWLIFLIGYVGVIVAQIIAIVVLLVMKPAQAQLKLSEAQVTAAVMDGDTIGITFLIALPLMILTLLLVVKFRRKKSFVSYMGLYQVKAGVLIHWFLYLAIFGVVTVALEYMFSRPPLPEWMLQTYRTTNSVWLLFVAVGILGPITEELLYRGYILRVWSQSKLGVAGSVLLLSLVWAGTHLQYDLYDMLWIALFGVILSISRLTTGSIIPAICMHMVWNSFSMAYMVMTFNT